MDPTTQYMTGQMRPHYGELFDAFQRESDAVAAAPNATLDIAYGAHPREVFDFFAAPDGARGVLAYFHAGYWQSRDKSLFRFLAPAFVASGIDVAMVNYPLCPDVSLPALVEATRRSVPAVLRHAATLGRYGTRLVASGHSAGAHIAAELALTDWRQRGLTASPIAAVAALSGVYDLEPLIETPLNDRLRLDATTARAMSPIRRVRGGMPEALFVVGGTETPAFIDQNAAMHEAWIAGGNAGTRMAIDDEDHFSLLRALQRPGELLNRMIGLFG